MMCAFRSWGQALVRVPVLARAPVSVLALASVPVLARAPVSVLALAPVSALARGPVSALARGPVQALEQVQALAPARVEVPAAVRRVSPATRDQSDRAVLAQPERHEARRRHVDIEVGDASDARSVALTAARPDIGERQVEDVLARRTLSGGPGQGAVRRGRPGHPSRRVDREDGASVELVSPRDPLRTHGLLIAGPVIQEQATLIARRRFDARARRDQARRTGAREPSCPKNEYSVSVALNRPCSALLVPRRAPRNLASSV